MYKAKNKILPLFQKNWRRKFSFAQFQSNIADHKKNLFNHDIYKQVNEIRKAKFFMESHIFGLWDYLTMLKSLQRELASRSILLSEIPNLPFLINQIVLNEEVDEEGSREYLTALGLYQLYIKAMEEISADSRPITYFVDLIKAGTYWKQALYETKENFRNIPDTTYSFLEHNLNVIEFSKIHVIAGVFFFGREDIHYSFGNFLKISQEKDINISHLRSYLQRHIDDDGETKNPKLGEYILNLLCKNDNSKWKEVEVEVISSIQKRNEFWDGIVESFEKERLIMF
jgi:hypothetical protein